MELGQRLKEYRGVTSMTQDELADKLYVTRQTISNWENDRSYPDIHSLLRLSEVFHVSLDTLIKGDLDIMKEKIDKEKIRSFRRDSNIFGILMLLMVLSGVPLIKGVGIPGAVAWALLVAVTMYYGWRLEKIKKEEDIYTYREILAFTKGEKLDSLQKAREEGKRIYQPIVLAMGAAAVGGIAAWLIHLLMRLL